MFEIANGKFSKYLRNLQAASLDCRLALQSKQFPRVSIFFSESQHNCGSVVHLSIAQWHHRIFLGLNDPNGFIGLWFWNICNFIIILASCSRILKWNQRFIFIKFILIPQSSRCLAVLGDLETVIKGYHEEFKAALYGNADSSHHRLQHSKSSGDWSVGSVLCGHREFNWFAIWQWVRSFRTVTMPQILEKENGRKMKERGWEGKRQTDKYICTHAHMYAHTHTP